MIDLLKKKESTPVCKGLIFRAHVNSYVSSHRSIEVKKSLRLLKRKSCKGCEKCEWIWDYIQENIFDGEIEDYVGEVENGKMYKIEIIHHSGMYEYPNECEMEVKFNRWEEIKANCMKIFAHYDPCPNCGSQLECASGGGVKCTNKKCNNWFCY